MVRGESAGGGGDGVGREVEVGEQLASLAMLDESIGDAEAANVGRGNAGVGGGFKEGTGKTAGEAAFFDRDHKRGGFQGA